MAKKSPLGNVSLFDDLSDEQLVQLESVCESRKYDVGQTIFSEGDSGTHIYCVIDGRVEISLKLGNATEEAPVHTAVEGSFFGEFVLFDNSCTRTATARAVKAVSIIAVGVKEMNELFDKDPLMGYRVMRNMGCILISRMNKTTNELRASLMW